MCVALQRTAPLGQCAQVLSPRVLDPRSKIQDPRSKIARGFGDERPYWVELLLTPAIFITGDAEIQRTPAALVLVALVVLAAIALDALVVNSASLGARGRRMSIGGDLLKHQLFV